jgi:hypothetical protein
LDYGILTSFEFGVGGSNMGQAIPPITFPDETIAAIEKTLDLKLSSARRELLKRILLEWCHIDLVEHLTHEPRPILKKRVNRLEKVKKHARKLSKALSALEEEDLGGLIWRGQYISKGQYINKTEYQRLRERLVEVSQYIADLGTIAPEAYWPLKGPRPPTITAYRVLQDAAAIFEWLTETMATRETDRDTHSEKKSPFFRFASILWPVVFGKGTTGLPSAIKNWAGWRKEFGEHSPLITNIALRHRTWGIFERKEPKSPM